MIRKQQVKAYFISRHEPMEKQHKDMLRILSRYGITEYTQIRKWNLTDFGRITKAKRKFGEECIIFLVGTMRHALLAKRCGYIIYRPRFHNRTAFHRHYRFVQAKPIEVLE